MARAWIFGWVCGTLICTGSALVAQEAPPKKADAPPPKKAVPAVEVTETCPECGAPMKLRPSRRGYFLGCSKYPKCRGTREASAELLEQV